MNENINLVEILKDAPKGTKLYSPLLGYVTLVSAECKLGKYYPIMIEDVTEAVYPFTKNGQFFLFPENTECLLFPSKDQRDWSKFKAPWKKAERFNPETLQPYDKVLVRDGYSDYWIATFFSHMNFTGKAAADGTFWEIIIPYNEDTKHLVGTADEAPEYYRYWEDQQ